MMRIGLAHAATSSAATSRAVNDDGLLQPALLAGVRRRDTPANDNPARHDLPACVPITDEEVRFLHRYLGAQILGLFA
jgi:hypothetical protein